MSKFRSRARSVALFGSGTFVASQALLLYRQPSWRAAAFPPKDGTSANGPHSEVLAWSLKNSRGGEGANKPTAVVVGGGVAGICSAYRLARKSYDVIVLDATPEGAAGKGSSSAAAAGGMDKGHKFSTPKDWQKMVAQLVPFGGGYRFFQISWVDVLPDLFFWRWLARFASESLFATEQRIEEKRALFRPVVAWGIEQTVKTMREVPGLESASHFRAAGSVQVVGDSSGGYGGGGGAGASSETVSAEEAARFEPLLASSESVSASVSGENPKETGRFIINPETRFGECVSFTKHLAAYCEQKLGVRIVKDAAVTGFHVKNLEDDRRVVTAIHTSRGRIDVVDDKGGEKTVVILCGGAWSGILCDMLGVFCPIYPLKGYTLEVDLEGTAPHQRLTRLLYNAAVYAVPAGPRLRIASLGAFDGWDTSVDPHVEESLKTQAEKLVPAMKTQIRSTKTQTVAGLRPFSADELPLVGRVPKFENVYLNTGPGHTGWKCASGFAEVLAGAVFAGTSKTGELEKSCPEPAVKFLDPAVRLGTALTGPRLLREVQTAVWRVLGS